MAASEYLLSHTAQEASNISLEHPAIQAVLFMEEYDQNLLLTAANKVKAEKGSISASDLLEALDKLPSAQQHPLIPAFSRLQQSGRDPLGSDGEDEESDSLPPVAEPEKMEVDDLQMDGEAQASSQRFIADASPRVQAKEAGRGSSAETDIYTLRQKVKVLKSENRLLKTRSLCKNCLSKPVSITFLPCGHYSYCYDCGQTFNACPICRKTILADVRTFLA